MKPVSFSWIDIKIKYIINFHISKFNSFGMSTLRMNRFHSLDIPDTLRIFVENKNSKGKLVY